jgi:ribonuclease VapC
MFVDASALVALVAREAGHRDLAKRLEDAAAPITSGIAIFEATLAVRRIDGGTIDDAERFVARLLRAFKVETIPVAEAETRAALRAFARFGKGQGHPARLNLGDCFAYACATVRSVPLLFVGEDFVHTDIPAAMR